MLEPGPLGPRSEHLAAWTGAEMLIWGGYGDSGGVFRWFSNGAAYQPSAGTWRRMAPSPPRFDSIAASALVGTEWFIAGTDSARSTAATVQVAAYDFLADAWRELPPIDAPGAYDIWLVSVGDTVVLGLNAEGSQPTAMYQLSTERNVWARRSDPPGDDIDSPIWTGERLIGFGSQHSWNFFAAWDPVNDTWAILRQPPIEISSPVWTGGRLILARNDAGGGMEGAVYDPSANSWSTFEGTPSIPESDALAVWAGDRVVIWGGGGLGHRADGLQADADGVVLIPSP